MNNLTIEQTQQELIKSFTFFDDWMDKYRHIIDLGRKLPKFPDELKTDKNRIFGCQSMVWIYCKYEDGTLKFQAISDSAIVSGLIAILLRVFNERTPVQILDSKVEFIDEIGLGEHLSPTRANGLHAMLKQIWAYATVLKAVNDDNCC